MKYIKESYRFFRKHIGYSVINLGGLALGLAVFLLLHLFIQQQKNYDTFWEGHDSIYRIGTVWEEADEIVSYATAPPPLAGFLDDYEEVQAVTRLVNWSHFTMRPDNDSTRVFRETNVYIADAQFFDVFQNRLLAGTTDALSEPGNVVLSETALRKYFGLVDPVDMIGRLLLGGKDAGTPWKITGVFRDMPSNSHMNFDIMVSMWDEFSESDIWTWNVMHTYVRSTSNPGNLNEILENAVEDKVMPYLIKQGAISSGNEIASYAFEVDPIRKVHLQTGLRDAMEPGIRTDYLDILSAVSILIIFLACFNYMNISTALSYSRIRNVGIMKIHGATFRQLFFRYMGEYMVQSIIALLVAVGLIELILLFVNDLYSLHLSVRNLLTIEMLGLMLGLVLFCAILSGFYPTWRLLRGKPTLLIKGESSSGKPVLRNLLITGQFAISLFLIACTLTLNNQLEYIRNMEPGFNRENILVVQNDKEIEEEREAFVQALNKLPEVSTSAFTTGLPALARYQVRDIKVHGTDVRAALTWYESDDHYLETMKIALIAGEGFVKGQSGQAILNESAVRTLGLTNPVGATLIVNEGAQDEHTLMVKGVTEDFHQRDFRQETEPLIIEYLDSYIFRDFIAIRYSAGNPTDAVKAVRNIWQQFEPDVPMDYFFFDSSFDALFQSEKLLNELFSVFSMLALVIAMIGLLGVVAITARQRMREIGIRKVLGATSGEIIGLMLRQFTLLILIACFVSLPISWIVSASWLNEFVFKTRIHIMTFIYTGAIVFGLASIIVSFLAWRSSRMNPVTVIRKDS